MTYFGMCRGRALLFFALLMMPLLSCSNQEPTANPPIDSATTIPTSAPVAESPTLGPESNTDGDDEAAALVPEPATISAPPTNEPTPPAAATDQPQPTAIPEPTITPVLINGMPSDQFIIMPEEVRQNIDEIFAHGQSLGRNSEVFAILGDSLIATNQSLAKWDGDDYVLGDYAYLQPTIDYYAGSFGRYGVSVRVGLHSWSVFDPLWADKDYCLANEDLLTCELRLNNPSVVIIFLGSNDAGSPGGFDFNYRQIVDNLVGQGIVPILATKADRFEGPDNVNNEIIRQIAVDFQVPLLEFDLLADTLPGRGLSPDNIHLTYLEPLDYTVPEMFTLGYPVHNLASLMIIDEVRRAISD